jgi:hypothetical protein
MSQDEIMNAYARALMGEEDFIRQKRRQLDALDKAMATTVQYWWPFLPSKYQDEEESD